MKILDVTSIQDIPGYVEILKFVLKSQIQNLVEQLQDHAGEETLVLSANLTAGTLSHLESDRGQGFLDMREDIKSQFLTHCLQGKQKYHTAEPPGQINVGNRLIGSSKPYTAEPQCYKATSVSDEVQGQSGSGPPSDRTSNLKSSLHLLHDKTVKLSSAGKSDVCTTKVTTDRNMSTQSNSLGILETGSNRSVEQAMAPLIQTVTGPLAQPSHLDFFHNRECQDDNVKLLQHDMNKSVLGSDKISQQTMTGTLTIQPLEKLKNSNLAPNAQQNDNENPIFNPYFSKASRMSTYLSGSLTNLTCLAGPITSLPTINQSAVNDLMGLYGAQTLPQYIFPVQQSTTPVKQIDGDVSSVSTLKSSHSASVMYTDTSSSSEIHKSPVKSTPVTNTLYSENFTRIKDTPNISLLPENIYSSYNKQDINLPAKEQMNKTAKRKQKRSSGSKPNSGSVLDTQMKKARTLNQTLTTNVVNTITSSGQTKNITNVHSMNPLLANSSAPNVQDTSGLTFLKMQPVVLVNDPNEGERKIFIESGTVNPAFSGGKPSAESSKSLLIEQNGQLANIGSSTSRQTHVIDVKEKDKTKKTLSSKIDEITQRITKDDAIKQHTVHTRESNQSGDVTCSVTARRTPTDSSGGADCVNTDAGSHDVSNPPSVEHLNDGDPSKLKDGSRASHRKPKLPRFNIGVASDDEDNAEIVESPGQLSSDTSSHDAAKIDANISQVGTPPSSVNISHDDAQDIINIQVSVEDTEASFPHLNLEELADGLLLTDIPIVSYYNSVEESGKSLIESVFNLKPARDPSTKKPLNSQSVIVSGSKVEKDWVKCPLCPDKFLTVEALQYHIKNVNHVAKKYECDLCKRKFSQLRDMERHRRIHTGERPFTCDVCNKSFSRKDNLKSHARKHSTK